MILRPNWEVLRMGGRCSTNWEVLRMGGRCNRLWIASNQSLVLEESNSHFV